MFFTSRQKVLSISSTLIILMLAIAPGCVAAYQPKTTAPTAQPMAVPQHSYSLNEWNVPTGGGGPWWITVDKAGKIWFTENVTGKIGMLDPLTNNITEWTIPGGGSPRYITTKQVTVSGTNHTRVYFTLYSSNQIAYFDPWTSTFHEWTLSAGSNPVGIYVDVNGTIWFTESGRDVIGKIVPSNNQLTEWPLPGATGSAGSPRLQPWAI
jgi:streptogramin lyase